MKGRSGRDDKGDKSSSANASNAPGEERGSISQYIFSFELAKNYPPTRSFIIKQPLKRSFGDTFMELFGGGKKTSSYKTGHKYDK